MTPQEANRIIHEAMGLCWHEVSKSRKDFGGLNKDIPVYGCSKCDQWRTSTDTAWLKNPDYHTPEGFFECWNWAKEQDWWEDFLRRFADKEYDLSIYPQEHIENIMVWAFGLVDHQTFATVLAEFTNGMRK